jgi:lipoic acid synthetase
MARRHPDWLKVKLPSGDCYMALRSMIDEKKLHTVCQSAHCPNIEECFNRGVATFMILGDVCTRNCLFCNISNGKPQSIDPEEPLRVAQAVMQLGLRYVVITSVTRDDLPDGGAHHFAATIEAIKQLNVDCEVEVLIPDFQGCVDSLKKVIQKKPKVLNHNIETVKRLYPIARAQADYHRSLELLENAKSIDPQMLTKSGLIIGLGEEYKEILETLEALRTVQCDIVTIGQYLQPTEKHLPIKKYYHPKEFHELKNYALKAGFRWVESGPLVRSSYHADGLFREY